jgi:hypothetical protein
MTFAKAGSLQSALNGKSQAMDAVSVHPMAGDGTAVTVHQGRKLDPSVSQPSVCLIDGDSKQQDSITDFRPVGI